MWRYSIVFVVCLGLLSAPATADDWFAPDWRGDPGTITAEWELWAPVGDGGAGSGSIFPTFYYGNPGNWPGWPELPPGAAHWGNDSYVFDAFSGRQGVLELGTFGDPEALWFNIQGYGGYDDPSDVQVRFQITYLPGLGAPMDFIVGDMDPFDQSPPWNEISAVVTDAYDHPDGWKTAAYDFSVQYDSYQDGLGIGVIMTQYPIHIDQVVIDIKELAYVVPAPATLTLLAAGAVLFRRRRRA